MPSGISALIAAASASSALPRSRPFHPSRMTAEQQGRFAVVADQEGRRIFVAPLHFGDVGELQRTARGDRRIADLLQIVDGAVQPDEDLRALGFDRAGGRHGVRLLSAAKMSRGDTPSVARRS